ncbi:MAG: response regulator transcription factor [Solirubrobacteraceae bacterium]|nr:response regulator transcription factor [Solirubrobacteraceae bacterium]
MRLLVVDPHPIFRQGLAASLEAMHGVSGVTQAQSPDDAVVLDELPATNLVVLDTAAHGGVEFIATVREQSAAPVLVCTSDCREPAVFAALREGAAGFLRKEQLTHEALQAAIAAVRSGASVLSDDLLAGVVRAGEAGDAPGRTIAQLSDREQAVLALIAEGHPTREIALQLSYSERTVKNVLHDVVTKLGVRSRSQAVAQAVRDGLI